jgi:uncharacterized tellurite resistance protein B-like protein
LPNKGSARRADTETVLRITRELEAMDREEARYLALFAFLLSRVAHADSHVSPEETREMERAVERWGGLSPAHAVLVVQIAKEAANLIGNTEDAKVTRQFKLLSLPVQRHELLHCLFAVSAADDSISVVEETVVKKIALELGLSEHDFHDIRSSYDSKRRGAKRTPEPAVPRDGR